MELWVKVIKHFLKEIYILPNVGKFLMFPEPALKCNNSILIQKYIVKLFAT